MKRREFIRGSAWAGAAAALMPSARNVTAAAAPATQGAAGTASKDADLQARLEAALARHRVPGASVALFKGGKVTTAAAGVANISTGIGLTTDTVMLLGSITKVFNATLVMQLVDEGKVDLDERVVRYLPDFKVADREALQRITVKMLLNHTSGIEGIGAWPNSGHDEETIEKAVRRFAQLGQLYPPGAEFSYCNPGMVIAGYLAQRLTGKSWYQLVKERIFRPLQMQNAASLPEDALLHRASVGHFLNPAASQPQWLRTSHVFLPLAFGPAGRTLMMSAGDLMTFARAHMNNGVGVNGVRILSERSAKAMQQVTVDNSGKGYAPSSMGVGWMIDENGILHHGGGGPGILTGLYVHPQRQFAAAILTNAAHGSVLINDLMATWLKEIGLKPMGLVDVQAPPSTRVKVDGNKYVGTYQNGEHLFHVSAAGGDLLLARQMKWPNYDTDSTQPSPPARLIPLGGDRFLLAADKPETTTAVEAGRLCIFKNPDASGRMQHLATGLRLNKRASSPQPSGRNPS